MPGRMNNTFYNPMISLIVPVYNAEEYLDDAVKSVWDQSFANWELLLIDDGSTDKSGEICDQFAEADHRIKVFHTENGGYNRARNIGIENASGEWVMFLDSDDYLAPDALQHMVDWSERSDLVMALYQTTPVHTREDKGIKELHVETLRKLSDVLTELYEPYFFLSVTAKLYRKSILENGFAAEKGDVAGDWLYNFQILPNCKGISFVPEVVYYYRSGDHLSHSSHFHSDLLYVSKLIYKKVNSLFPNNPEIEDFMVRRYAYRVKQYITHLAALKSLDRIYKLAMIEAERKDSFYNQSEINQTGTGNGKSEIWNAFMNGDADTALKEAEEQLSKE